MGKYNFNYEKIKTLEAEKKELETENYSLKGNIEQLSKAVEILTREVMDLKKSKPKKKPSHSGFSKYIRDDVAEKLFNVKAAGEGQVITGDEQTLHSNTITFYSNIVRAIRPIGRCVSDKTPFLSHKPFNSMTTAEQEAIGEAIQKCAEICYETKMKLEGLE